MRACCLALALALPALASTAAGQLPFLPTGIPAGSAMQVLLLLTALTLLPALIMSVTPFLRITVVLHFLRQALGTQTTPSNQVLVGMALFLSALIVQPVVSEIYHQSWEPLESGQITAWKAYEEGSKPLKKFLFRFAREKDIRLILEVSRSTPPRTPDDLELGTLIPAYILSELRTGFQIGAVLYLPFLIIELVVASVTLSIGMVQLPPVMLSAPFKILLFVLVDGWNLVIGSLVRSFY
jgi:flagellar biosynthesis protein FliP